MQHEPAEPAGEQVADDDDERGRLPVVPLAALTTSGTFAVWTSLTCFVC